MWGVLAYGGGSGEQGVGRGGGTAGPSGLPHARALPPPRPVEGWGGGGGGVGPCPLPNPLPLPPPPLPHAYPSPMPPAVLFLSNLPPYLGGKVFPPSLSLLISRHEIFPPN